MRFLALLLLLWSPAAAPAPDEGGRVLVVHSYRNSLPINADFFDGIVTGLEAGVGSRFEIDSETLDLSRLHNEDFVAKLIEVYRLKYQGSPPDVIVATDTPALRLLLRHRDAIFPGIPVVFSGAELSPEELLQLPPDVTGITARLDMGGTLELMLRLHPDMKTVALIVGSGELDGQMELEAREALRPYENKLNFLYLRGFPLSELEETVRELPPHIPILYLVQFADRDGVNYVPRKIAQAVAAAANAPVYGLWDTLLDAGIVGGRMAAIKDLGGVAGGMARRILSGEPPAAIPVVRGERNGVIVDGRQMKRWGLDEHLLPAGSRVLHPQHSVWEDHWGAILVGAGVITLQGAGIAALLINRRRLQRARASLLEERDHRIRAENGARQLHGRLRAAEKQGNLGALAGGIAHEVNQPLIAIKNYAQAARRYIPDDAEHAGKLAELLAEMESEAGRAGAVIGKVRRLLSSGQVDAVPLALEPVVQEVLGVISLEAQSRGCRIDYHCAAPVPMVLADALQVQLVLVNLLRNAMEATVSRGPGGGGSISVTAGETGEGSVQLSVADCGTGVAAEDAESIFDAYYSTKPSGMGIGLATCRSIIAAHGGRIWHMANPAGGATFAFTLPVAEAGG